MANLLVSIPTEFWNYFIKYIQSLGFYFKTLKRSPPMTQVGRAIVSYNVSRQIGCPVAVRGSRLPCVPLRGAVHR
jgi:hypothetical protein